MRAFREIHASYIATDSFLAQAGASAHGTKTRAHFAKLRLINDQAYFVMLFAQFEQFIDEQCLKLINRKKASNAWKNRRLWDSTDPERLQFMRKVALLTEKGGSAYNQIDQYYDQRCNIAHGTPLPPGAIVVSIAAPALRSLARLLRQ